MPYVLECVGEVAAGGVLAFLMEVHMYYSPHSLELEYGSIFFKLFIYFLILMYIVCTY